MSENIDVLKFNERLSKLEKIKIESGDWTEEFFGMATDKDRRKFSNIPHRMSNEFKNNRRRLTKK